MVKTCDFKIGGPSRYPGSAEAGFPTTTFSKLPAFAWVTMSRSSGLAWKFQISPSCLLLSGSGGFHSLLWFLVAGISPPGGDLSFPQGTSFYVDLFHRCLKERGACVISKALNSHSFFFFFF